MDANTSDKSPYDNRHYHGLTARFLANIATAMPHLGWSLMQCWNENPKDLQIALTEALLSFQPEKMLEFIGYEYFSPGPFDGEKNFISTEKAPIQFEFINGNFNLFFMDKFRDEAPKFPENQLLVNSLLVDRFDVSVLVLIGKSNASIRLSQFHALLRKQGKGQLGSLRVDGGLNIVHMVSHTTLWRVSAKWIAEKGWRIEAELPAHGDRLPAGTIVIFR